MKERIVFIRPSRRRYKKYDAILDSGRTISFGDNRYPQYKDSTHIGRYSSKDHDDKERRKRYFLRHSGVGSKVKALKKEKRKSNGKYTAKILSHIYLW